MKKDMEEHEYIINSNQQSTDYDDMLTLPTGTSAKLHNLCEIFVSYSRNDKSIVLPFIERISNEVGVNCWIDLSGIESGSKFERKIIDAIDASKIVLFMLSDSSLKSEWTEREVFYADGEKKRIVPILIDGNRLRGWFKFHFGNVDYIDIRSESQKNKLLQNLRTWLNK